MRAPTLLLALLASWPVAGCAAGNQVGRDFGEALHFGVGGSLYPGVYANAQLSPFGASIGYLPDAWYVGTDFGYATTWRQEAWGLLAFAENEHTQVGRASPYLDWIVFAFVTGPHEDLRRMKAPLLEMQLQVHLVFAGVSFGVQLIELTDAVLGLFGFDILADNGYEPSRAELIEPERTLLEESD